MWLCQIGFAHSFLPQIHTAVSLSILDQFTWNFNYTLSYMYSLCLVYNKFNYCSISNSCFWVPGVIFVIQTALANAEHHRIAWYCTITSPDTTFRCSENFVSFDEHLIGGTLLHSAWGHKQKVMDKLNAAVFLQWDIHQMRQNFLSI
jgi:hypothetical protein